MRRIALAALAAAGLVVPSTPASAVAVSFGVTGGITVYPDLGACAYLDLVGPFVGVFAAVAEVQGPGTRVGTVRGAVPIVSTGRPFSACIPGAYTGATVGEGKYTLSGSGGATDYVEVKQCTVSFGVVRCV